MLALHSEDAEARFLCTKEDTNYLAGAGIGMSNNRFLKRDESNSSRGHRVMQEWHAPCQGNGWPPFKSSRSEYRSSMLPAQGGSDPTARRLAP